MNDFDLGHRQFIHQVIGGIPVVLTHAMDSLHTKGSGASCFVKGSLFELEPLCQVTIPHKGARCRCLRSGTQDIRFLGKILWEWPKGIERYQFGIDRKVSIFDDINANWGMMT